MASIQPPCVITHINICVKISALKIQNTGSHTIIWTHENTAYTHTLIGIGSAALAAAVPSPGKATQSFPQGRMKYLKERKELVH